MKLTKTQIRKIIYESLFEDTEVSTGLGPELNTLSEKQGKYILNFAVDNKGTMIDVHSSGNAPYILADLNSDGDRSYVYAITKGSSDQTPKITIVRSPKSGASFVKPQEVKSGSKGYKAIKKLFDDSRDASDGRGIQPAQALSSIK
jgi:hypothetical protein